MWLLAESMVHDFDPVAIWLSSDLAIRWYGLAYLAGFLIAWGMLRWMSRTKRSLVPERSVGDLIMYAVVGVIAGGRLGYAAFYQPSLLWTFSDSLPWWELLAIHRGGMASHGAMIGIIVSMWLFARRQHVPTLHVVDLVCFVATPGLLLGRLANLINGELWGKPLPASMQIDPPWWSIKYPDEVLLGHIDLTAVAPHVTGDGTLGDMTAAALRRGDPQVVEAIVPQMTAFWPSQFLQGITEGPVVLGVLALVWLLPRKPGVITGCFLITYGCLRMLTELVRQADAGVELILGLQRGQLLSVVMILTGIVLLAVCQRGQGQRVGGLRAAPASSDG
ncbi:MAG: prolipoprotein diacylglyceryl transferase [Phycisphaerales bacterium]|nr:prolipoprotein diacylglyceryl transferase [Phycisphaerales bacterium]